ncbi:MAG: fructose-6-phosphate aldolase [Rhizobiales bacterium]|nr:fructose-6-phosphate aldolase [Hyphomicrobiales bacterium]
MKFFADSADIAELRACHDMGLVDGVTTNPSIIAKSGRKIREVIAEICSFVEGPVSAEVAALDFDGMVREGSELSAIAKNVAVKVPLTPAGLKACRHFREKDVMVNVTLCFSANQALLAAKAGATFISPFVGRLDDIGLPGMDLIGEIRTIYDNYGFDTNILAASMRTVNHIKEAALIGADYATAPPAVLKALYSHPLTDKGIESFLADWKKSGQSI